MSNPLIYRRGGYSDKMILGMEADYNVCNKMGFKQNTLNYQVFYATIYIYNQGQK